MVPTARTADLGRREACAPTCHFGASCGICLNLACSTTTPIEFYQRRDLLRSCRDALPGQLCGTSSSNYVEGECGTSRSHNYCHSHHDIYRRETPCSSPPPPPSPSSPSPPPSPSPPSPSPPPPSPSPPPPSPSPSPPPLPPPPLPSPPPNSHCAPWGIPNQDYVTIAGLGCLRSTPKWPSLCEHRRYRGVPTNRWYYQGMTADCRPHFHRQQSGATELTARYATCTTRRVRAATSSPRPPLTSRALTHGRSPAQTFRPGSTR